MSSILGAHREIVALDFESNAFVRIGLRPTKTRSILQLMRLYLLLIRQGVKAGNIRFCEKTPRNVLHVPAIRQVFKGGAKFILMIRDGRDILTSVHPQKVDYYIPIERWMNDTIETLKYAHDDDVLIVPYESIISHFDLTVTKICEFIGSEFDPRMREFFKYSSVQAHGAFHKGRPEKIYKSSLDRWKDNAHSERVRQVNSNTKATELLDDVEQFINRFISDLT